MKRWTVLLSRGGTTVIAIGLALLLVSLIPPTPMGSSMRLGPLPSETWQTFYEDALTPQQSLHVTITANGTLSIYILEVSSQVIYGWINEHYSGSADFTNVTYFNQFLDSNGPSIASQGETLNGTFDYEYSPTGIVNVTLAVSNHGPDDVSINFTGSLFRSVAPASKAQTLSEFTIPIGAALTLPWLSNHLTAKKRRSARV
jgi:hypothetical protein